MAASFNIKYKISLSRYHFKISANVKLISNLLYIYEKIAMR